MFVFFQLSYADVGLPKKKILFEAVVYHHGGPEKYELFEHGDHGYLVFSENNVKKHQRIYSLNLAKQLFNYRIAPVLKQIQKKEKTKNLALCSVRVDSRWNVTKKNKFSSYCLGDERGNALSPLLHQMQFLVKQ